MRLTDSTALLTFGSTTPAIDEPQRRFALVDSRGYQEVNPPLPDSAASRLHTGAIAASNGEAWMRAFYCPKMESACEKRDDLPAFLLRWRPGQPARIIRGDSAKVLDGHLVFTKSGRLLIVGETEVRRADDWTTVARFDAGTSPAIRSVIDDTTSGDLTMVTDLGEVIRVNLPTAENGTISGHDHLSIGDWVRHWFAGIRPRE